MSTQAGSHLQGRKTKNTKPEMALRKVLHGRGLRYRLHQSVVGRCKPDIIFSSRRVAVFVDGCFWHNCPEHGPKIFRGPNADRWKTKIATNQQRDLRNVADLEGAGWEVIRVWECAVKRDVESVANQVEARLREG